MFIINLVFIISTLYVLARDGKQYWKYLRAEFKEDKPLPMLGLVGVLFMVTHALSEVLK